MQFQMYKFSKLMIKKLKFLQHMSKFSLSSWQKKSVAEVADKYSPPPYYGSHHLHQLDLTYASPSAYLQYFYWLNLLHPELWLRLNTITPCLVFQYTVAELLEHTPCILHDNIIQMFGLWVVGQILIHKIWVTYVSAEWNPYVRGVQSAYSYSGNFRNCLYTLNVTQQNVQPTSSTWFRYQKAYR